MEGRGSNSNMLRGLAYQGCGGLSFLSLCRKKQHSWSNPSLGSLLNPLKCLNETLLTNFYKALQPTLEGACRRVVKHWVRWYRPRTALDKHLWHVLPCRDFGGGLAFVLFPALPYFHHMLLIIFLIPFESHDICGRYIGHPANHPCPLSFLLS